MFQCALQSDLRVDETSTQDELYGAIYGNPQQHELINSSRFNEDFEDIFSIISREFKLNDSSSSDVDIRKNTLVFEADSHQTTPESVDTVDSTTAEGNIRLTSKVNENAKSNDADTPGIAELTAEDPTFIQPETCDDDAYVKDSSPQAQTQSHFKCTRCESVFFQKYLCEAHIRIFHKSVWPRKTTSDKSTQLKCYNGLHCELCDEDFTSDQSLVLHDIIFHRTVISQKCSFCAKVFVTKILLDKHIVKAHPSRRPFSCDICGLSFALKNNMDSHISEHYDNLDKNNNSRSGAKKDVQSKKLEIQLSSPARLSTEFVESPETIKSSKRALNSESEATGETIVMESNDWQIDDDSTKLSRKRRKLESGSVYSYSLKNENPENLFNFECMKCHIILQSISLVAEHKSQCPNHRMAIDDSSSQQEINSHSESQQDDQQKDNDYPHQSECNSDDKMQNGREENRMVINCGFCTFIANNFLSYNNHLLQHGI